MMCRPSLGCSSSCAYCSLLATAAVVKWKTKSAPCCTRLWAASSAACSMRGHDSTRNEGLSPCLTWQRYRAKCCRQLCCVRCRLAALLLPLLLCVLQMPACTSKCASSSSKLALD
eukprot:1694-Heterococcus_DN1.PRE.1